VAGLKLVDRWPDLWAVLRPPVVELSPVQTVVGGGGDRTGVMAVLGKRSRP
jgi:hypothetical protein